jgi:hypothetical protein
MIPSRLLNQPLSLYRADLETLDQYGNTIEGTHTAPVTVQGYLTQTGSNETLVDRDTVVTNWEAYLPPTTVISHLDWIGFQNQTFQVTGNPMVHYNPRTKRVSHITVQLVTVLG